MVTLLRLRQFHRLVTHEDAVFFHMHKILGLLVLGNFAYRFYLWYLYGTVMLESVSTPVWMLAHTALHVTSFQFILSTRRNKMYNIIWPEMRWHTLIFAYRSIIAVMLQWLAVWNFYPMWVNDVFRGSLVMLTILAADFVTNHYKKQDMIDSTTMRGNPYPKWVPEWYIRYHNLFYSVSQVLATLNILYQREMGRLFWILLPIQTAPFCMTLVKKGIIDQFAWHFYYTAALLFNYVYGAMTENNQMIVSNQYYWTAFLTFVVFRFGFNKNKYVLWSLIILYSTYLQLRNA